jgi:hypothetical protein
MKTMQVLRRALIIAVIAFAGPGVASAQINDPSVKPVNVSRLEAKRPLVEYGMAGAFIVAALAIGFMPSKRTPESQ